MSHLIEKYKTIYEDVLILKEKIDLAKAEKLELDSADATELEDRIKNLQDQIDRIDEYVLKIKGYSKLAEEHIESLNLSTIDAPPGYRVNINRLKRWTSLIDPMSTDDAYAQKVYLVAQCDLVFLARKREEFLRRIEELHNEFDTGAFDRLTALNEIMDDCNRELAICAISPQTCEFIQDVVLENDLRWHVESPEAYVPENEGSDYIAIGTIGLPFDFGEMQNTAAIKELAGKYYDENGKRIYVPIDRISSETDFAMTISCVPARKRMTELDAGLRNMILNLIDDSPAGARKVYVIDGERNNTQLVGDLRRLEGLFPLANIPRNSEMASAQLAEIVSRFVDIDELIGNYDTVYEYNQNAEPENRIERSVVVLVGYPNRFEGNDLDKINKIMSNYDRYGISFVSVNINNVDSSKKDRSFGLSQYALEETVHIDMTKNDTTISFGTEAPNKFAWYTFKGNLADSYVDSIEKATPEDTRMGNDYTKRFDLTKPPMYVRGNTSIRVPFGIDSKDEVHYISFDKHNFAAYVVGDSGSGKSTFLHTLIAGILANYHPDDVELWLADFKQVEFKKYIEHRPPHVKYVLLDESKELIYDLIDKLNDEMLYRQRLIAGQNKEKIDELDLSLVGKPVPVIFIILDEFSIMSQAIADTQSYKIKLQNLLAKGRALGFKFLFSSQKFTVGIQGLTATARGQIQQRISLRGAKEEILETLELSSRLKTEKVMNWIDTLPPYYSLIKYRIDEETLDVNRLLVMYCSDNYVSRDAFIDRLNLMMKPSKEYHPEDVMSYLEKEPVLVDGNSFEPFVEEKIKPAIDIIQTDDTNNFAGDELCVVFGRPRLMDEIKPVYFAPENRQNLLLIGDQREKICSVSVINSVIECMKMQDVGVEIWAYDRNSLYRGFKDTVWHDIQGYSDEEDICRIIHELKIKIEDFSVDQEKLIVCFGMDSLCADFGVSSNKSFALISKAEPIAEETKKIQKDGMLFNTDVLSALQGLAISNNEEEEMVPEIELPIFSFSQTLNANQIEKEAFPKEKIEPKTKDGLYDARADLKYIVSNGGRQGIHFLFYLNALADLKETGLNDALFCHKVAFSMSAEDSRNFIGSKDASLLQERVGIYSDGISRFSFRPYLFPNIAWDGWTYEL